MSSIAQNNVIPLESQTVPVVVSSRSTSTPLEGNPQSSILLSQPMGTSGEANTGYEVVRPLKFFKLEKKDVDFQEERFKMIAAIVVAHSAVEAREGLQLYAEDFSFREVQPDPETIVEFWTNEDLSTCEEIAPNVPGFVIGEFA